MPNNYFNYLPLAIALLIIMRRSGRSQRVRVRRLWLNPLLGAVAVGMTLAQEPMPSFAAMAIFIAAGVMGAGAGYYRALHIELSLDPATGDVMSKATPLGQILIVIFLFVRFGLDYAFNGGWTSGPPRFVMPPVQHGVDLFRLADAALIFTTAMMVAQRFEVLRRAHLLLGAQKSQSAPAE